MPPSTAAVRIGTDPPIIFPSPFEAAVWLLRHCTAAEVQQIRLDVGRQILNTFAVAEHDDSACRNETGRNGPVRPIVSPNTNGKAH